MDGALCPDGAHLQRPWLGLSLQLSRCAVVCTLRRLNFYCDKFPHFHSPTFYTHGAILTYPAPAVVFLKLFQPFHNIHCRTSTAVFLLCLFCATAVMLRRFFLALIRRGLHSRSALILCAGTWLTSYAFWFEVHQANIEWVVWMLVTLGVFSFWTSRYTLAAVLFGIAGSMKIFPFVLLGLLLARKQFRLVGLSLAVAASSTFVSLWLVNPNILESWRQTSAAMDFIRQSCMLQLPLFFTGFDHSLFVLLKCITPVLPPPERLSHLLNLYLLVTALAGCLLFVVRIRKLPVANQVLCLSTASILFPPMSYDYTLIHLYVPFAFLVFVALERQPRDQRPLLVAFSLLALIFSAQAEFILNGIRRGGQLKAVALLALFVLGLVHPFSEIEPASEAQLAHPPATASQERFAIHFSRLPLLLRQLVAKP